LSRSTSTLCASLLPLHLGERLQQRLALTRAYLRRAAGSRTRSPQVTTGASLISVNLLACLGACADSTSAHRSDVVDHAGVLLDRCALLSFPLRASRRPSSHSYSSSSAVEETLAMAQFDRLSKMWEVRLDPFRPALVLRSFPDPPPLDRRAAFLPSPSILRPLGTCLAQPAQAPPAPPAVVLSLLPLDTPSPSLDSAKHALLHPRSPRQAGREEAQAEGGREWGVPARVGGRQGESR